MNKKYKSLLKITVIMLLFTTLLSIGACLPEKTRKIQIGLWASQPTEYSLGEFNIISSHSNNYVKIIGIRQSDKEDFAKMVESSPLCGGKVTIKDSSATDFLNKRNENVGNECYVISCEEYLWLGRFYMDKYFKITYISYTLLFSSNTNEYFINGLLLSPTDTEIFLEDIEYPTPWTWEELKIFFHFAQIDEDNHTFVFSQKDYPDGYTTAQITYNEQNSTLSVKQLLD